MEVLLLGARFVLVIKLLFYLFDFGFDFDFVILGIPICLYVLFSNTFSCFSIPSLYLIHMYYKTASVLPLKCVSSLKHYSLQNSNCLEYSTHV